MESRMKLPGLAALVQLMWFGYCAVAGVKAAENGTVPALIVFGDSTLDAGNNNFLDTVAKSNFPPYGRDFDTKSPTGRFTDGRLVSDFVATRLGLPMSLPYLHPNATGQSLLRGINFASAGSGYLDTTSVFLNVVPALKQVQMFEEYKGKLAAVVGPQQAASIVAEALYVVSTGSNDYILNYFVNPALQSQYSLSEFQAALLSTQTQFVQELHKVGARKIAILGLPALGCIPMQITIFGTSEQESCVEDQNAVAMAYNKELEAAVPQWQAKLPGAELLYLDAYWLLYKIFNNPSTYGYTETRRACCGEGMFSTAGFCNENSAGTCSDASKYVFFDSLHPTQSVYKLVADEYHEKLISYFKFKGVGKL